MTRRVFLFTWSDEDDVRMPALLDGIRARGAEPIVVLTDHFPTSVSLIQQDGPTTSRFFVDVGGGPVEVTADDTLWLRKVRPGRYLPEMPPHIREAAVAECRASMLGFLHAVPCAVIDPLHRIDRAAHKALQHVVATRAGLTVPATLVTNDPDAARSFVARCGKNGAIVKPHAPICYDDDERGQVGMPTTRVTDEVLANLDSLRLSPLIFQAYVPKAAELRVIVVGSAVYAAEIRPEGALGDQVDWRTASDALITTWREHTLPADVQAALLAHHDALGVQFGAADLILTPDGQYVFLETNTNGQFYWLEYHPPHLPITAAIADLLTDQPGARRR